MVGHLCNRGRQQRNRQFPSKSSKRRKDTDDCLGGCPSGMPNCHTCNIRNCRWYAGVATDTQEVVGRGKKFNTSWSYVKASVAVAPILKRWQSMKPRRQFSGHMRFQTNLIVEQQTLKTQYKYNIKHNPFLNNWSYVLNDLFITNDVIYLN